MLLVIRGRSESSFFIPEPFTYFIQLNTDEIIGGTLILEKGRGKMGLIEVTCNFVAYVYEEGRRKRRVSCNSCREMGGSGRIL